MTKLAYYSIAAAALLVAAGANAQTVKANAGVTAEPGILSAVSNTAGAVVEKSAQGINAVKGSYHQNMAETNAEAAKANLGKGDLNDAAVDAKDAAEHQSMAIEAKVKAADAKSKASKDWAKAKAAVSTSTTTK